MSIQKYRKQVSLLLKVLPVLSAESSLALHGGTAINLFHRNMPRLSVDIDLTYLPIADRDSSVDDINRSLNNVKLQIERIFPQLSVVLKNKSSKLFISGSDATIKLEVNLIKRGCYAETRIMSLCPKAQMQYLSFCETKIVETGHLYGGKICAALDRQHPRDLFDIHMLFKNEGITVEIMKGFIFYLICSNRPFAEMLNPNLIDQRSVFDKQFSGMTEENFTYDDFEATRQKLIKEIQALVSITDREFLCSIEEGNPAWHIYDFKSFPAVQWKLLNIAKLKEANPAKHRAMTDNLRELF